MAKNVVRPSNLACSRAINVSEGKMWQTNWETRAKGKSPLCNYDKAVLASKSYDMSKEKIEKEALEPNPQKGQACALSSKNDTLQLNYTVKILPVAAQVHSCPDEFYKNSLINMFNYAKEKNLFYSNSSAVSKII